MGEEIKQLNFSDIYSMDDTDNYVFKSHNLIESGYNFTLNEQRLTYLASKKLKPKYIKSNIKPSQLNSHLANVTFKDLKIHVNEFKDVFGIKSNNLYSVLKDTADSLYEKSIQYLQDDGTFVKKRWVTTCKYNDEGKYVELTFHPDLILDLLVIKGRFGKMNYNSIKTFKTTYAFRFYELLQNFAYKGIRTFELQDLRYKLGIYEDSKYSVFSDFKKRVIEPSVKSINDATNLNITYKPTRQGRNINGVEFLISQKSQCKNEILQQEETIDKSQVNEMEKILGVKLTAGTVAKLTDITIDSIREYKIDMGFYEYIEYEMNIVRNYARNNNIKNPIGLLKTALLEYWNENNIISPNKSKLIFNDYEQRECVTNCDYLSNLENKLLGWDTED